MAQGRGNQRFLDDNQYSRSSILKYEKMFGDGFVSTGGKETTVAFVKLLELKGGQKVLDVGAGIGGGAFYMAKNFGVEVTGIDLSTNMINIGQARMEQQQVENVSLMVADAMTVEFQPETFDVIYSRDTILHIKDKLGLFQRFAEWLKPSGRLLITDYCCGEGKHTDEFKSYINERGYHLLTVPQYGKILEDVGFIGVDAKDNTDYFIKILNNEKMRLEATKEIFLKDFKLEDFEQLTTGWNSKVVRCQRGEQKWGLIQARKTSI